MLRWTEKVGGGSKTIEVLEFIGVVMRIVAFATLSIMGKETPFLAMWIVNTVDALILTYCAYTRRNKAYTILNSFWLLVGAIGIYNSW
jgi:hypothetical protein